MLSLKVDSTQACKHIIAICFLNSLTAAVTTATTAPDNYSSKDNGDGDTMMR
jgi:hypothetical protein